MDLEGVGLKPSDTITHRAPSPTKTLEIQVSFAICSLIEVFETDS